jgi:hypothetical protein
MACDPVSDLQSLRDEVGRMFGSAGHRTRGGLPDVDLDDDTDG